MEVQVFSVDFPSNLMPSSAMGKKVRTLSQYDYTIKYRKTSEHGNTYVLNRLPIEPDAKFDNGEEGKDINTVCLIRSVGKQLLTQSGSTRSS